MYLENQEQYARTFEESKQGNLQSGEKQDYPEDRSYWDLVFRLQ